MHGRFPRIERVYFSFRVLLCVCLYSKSVKSYKQVYPSRIATDLNQSVCDLTSGVLRFLIVVEVRQKIFGLYKKSNNRNILIAHIFLNYSKI